MWKVKIGAKSGRGVVDCDRLVAALILHGKENTLRAYSDCGTTVDCEQAGAIDYLVFEHEADWSPVLVSVTCPKHSTGASGLERSTPAGTVD